MGGILHAVLEDGQAKAILDAARPVWVLVRQDVVFRMGHEAEDVSSWIADAGNIKQGAVRVVWVLTTGRTVIDLGVKEGNLVIFL